MHIGDRHWSWPRFLGITAIFMAVMYVSAGLVGTFLDGVLPWWITSIAFGVIGWKLSRKTLDHFEYWYTWDCYGPETPRPTLRRAKPAPTKQWTEDDLP